MGELSAWHWAIVAVVAMLLFGSRRLPDAARSIGRSARILRAELRAGTDSDQAAELRAGRSRTRWTGTPLVVPIGRRNRRPAGPPRLGS